MGRVIHRLDAVDRVGARLAWTGATPDVAYWHERWSRQDLTRAIADAVRHPILHEQFLRYTSVGGRVLEAGCGLGQSIVVLREAGRQVIGLDYDVTTLHHSRATPDHGTLPLLGGDVQHFPFGDAAFDSYISLGVAEHFIDGPHPMLREAHRVLRPGRHLLISVPYFSPFRQTRARLGRYHSLNAAQLPAADCYQFAFRPDEFARFLADAGFVVRKRVPFAPAVALREELRRQRTQSARPATIATASAREQGKTKGSRKLAQAILRTYPARWYASNMILFVAERRA